MLSGACASVGVGTAPLSPRRSFSIAPIRLQAVLRTSSRLCAMCLFVLAEAAIDRVYTLFRIMAAGCSQMAWFQCRQRQGRIVHCKGACADATNTGSIIHLNMTERRGMKTDRSHMCLTSSSPALPRCTRVAAPPHPEPRTPGHSPPLVRHSTPKILSSPP